MQQLLTSNSTGAGVLMPRCAVRRDGVSRLSAYHHFGMVSPFKVARDALATKSNGATKYVDEFFTWREVAHAFCFRSWPVLESTAAGLSSFLALATASVLVDVVERNSVSTGSRMSCLAYQSGPSRAGSPFSSRVPWLEQFSALPSEEGFSGRARDQTSTFSLRRHCRSGRSRRCSSTRATRGR